MPLSEASDDGWGKPAKSSGMGISNDAANNFNQLHLRQMVGLMSNRTMNK
jgi:hypothetical protein